VRYLKVLSGFPQFLHEKSGIVTKSGHDHYLPNPFQFIYNSIIGRYAVLCTRASVTIPRGKVTKIGHVQSGRKFIDVLQQCTASVTKDEEQEKHGRQNDSLLLSYPLAGLFFDTEDAGSRFL
jgi:hypothetical protein